MLCGRALLAAALGCAGCGGGGNSSTDDGLCLPGVFPADPAEKGDGDSAAPADPVPAALALVVGAEDPTKTHVGTVWRDGDRVALVTGAQGGFMIRPALDVSAPAPLTENAAHAACLAVRMRAGAPADAAPVSIGANATRIAGTKATYHVPALFGLLSSARDVEDIAVAITLDVQSPAGSGRAELSVVPDATVAP